MTIRAFVIIFALITTYFGSTWFYFGSAHPCEILLARQKDYRIDIAEKHDQEDIQSWKELARSALPAKDYERFVSNIQEYANASWHEENVQRSAIRELRQTLKDMTPAQCALQAITWEPPAAK